MVAIFGTPIQTLRYVRWKVSKYTYMYMCFPLLVIKNYKFVRVCDIFIHRLTR